MNKTIHALSGVSGAGKTHHRKNDEHLKTLPYLDIADIYAEFNRDHAECTPDTALMIFIDRAQKLLADHDEIVLEAYFRKGSKQRRWLEHYFYGIAEIKYIVLVAPYEICKERIIADMKADKSKRAYGEARLKLLDLTFENF
jgi:predicted kinase